VSFFVTSVWAAALSVMGFLNLVVFVFFVGAASVSLSVVVRAHLLLVVGVSFLFFLGCDFDTAVFSAGDIEVVSLVTFVREGFRWVVGAMGLVDHDRVICWLNYGGCGRSSGVVVDVVLEF
jgi:hypothetical protein